MFDNRFREQAIQLDEVTINFRIGGDGPPLLLLHGYPQTHFMWHKVAPVLSRNFTVICPDLRGYGDSSKPTGKSDHSNYSKRVMARDQIRLMSKLGHKTFSVAGHDRGARVAHRLALDFPDQLEKVAVIDIAPTLTMFESTNQDFATGYYHWFFLIQPDGLPEHMINLDPDFYLKETLKRWSGNDFSFAPEVVTEYSHAFKDPAAIHASCEDYRAAATIDLKHDRESTSQKMTQPLLVLWGKQGFIEKNFDVLSAWRDKAIDVEGYPLDCGHFLAEERPKELAAALLNFFNPQNI